MNISAMILLLASSLTAAPPSIKTVAPAGRTPAKSETTSKLVARCVSCPTTIEGQIEVTERGIAFCCTGMKTKSQLVTAKCPYSFTLPLSSVAQQFIDVPRDGDAVWHLVTTAKVHYAFASSDEPELQAAFDKLRSASKRILSDRLLEKYASVLAASHPPKLERGECQ